MTSPEPDDADREALQRLADSGADLSRPFPIDFAVWVPDAGSANRAAAIVAELGYATDIDIDASTGAGSLYCTRNMLATYENVVQAQTELNTALAACGLECDGWGSFGN
jgi:hypothetical protein